MLTGGYMITGRVENNENSGREVKHVYSFAQSRRGEYSRTRIETIEQKRCSAPIGVVNPNLERYRIIS